MSRATRREKIQGLELLRERPTIAYVTGDRAPNLAAQIAPDTLPLFYNLLAKRGRVPKLDLYLYTTGGMTMAAWGLVNLLREFTDHLSVLIPFRALSTGTLIALGADEIVMGRLGQLSPVDPTVTSPFNPPAPPAEGSPPGFLPVSVEDVRGFLDLARDEASLKDEKSILEVFAKLAGDVRPLALGSVNRAKEQIKFLTGKLIHLHDSGLEEQDIERIIETFTRKLYSHDYLIGRKEAKEIIGSSVVDAPAAVETAMWDLFSVYQDDLELVKAYSPEAVLGSNNQKVINLHRAFVENADGCYEYKTTREVRRIQLKQQGIPVGAVQERVIDEGWSLMQN